VYIEGKTIERVVKRSEPDFEVLELHFTDGTSVEVGSQYRGSEGYSLLETSDIDETKGL
jgi:hypothetical protein